MSKLTWLTWTACYLEYFADSSLPQHEQVVAALLPLAGDRDNDVREAASRDDRVAATPPPPPPPPAVAETSTTAAKERDEEEEEEGGEGGNSSSDPPSWAQIAAK